MFLQTFSMFVIRSEYYLNKDFISKTLCINKEKPKSNCNGKCYLAKKLKETEKQEEETPQGKKGKLEINIFIACASPVLKLYLQKNQIPHSKAENQELCSFPRFVFRPPAV